jgi:hypothetical protein
VRLRVDRAALRLAFSHLPLHRLLKAQVPILFSAMAVPRSRKSAWSSVAPLATQGDAAPKDAKQPTFRQSSTRVELHVQEASVWLCSDGRHSFGAPDVFQVPPRCHLQTSTSPYCR